MRVRAVIVGIDHWEDLTRPFATALKVESPELDVVVMDNASRDDYPELKNCQVIRIDRRGYGPALNFGASLGEWDWLMCCNNDCICTGDVMPIISTLSEDVVYGDAWKADYTGMEVGLPPVADSAYLLISRKVWNAIGPFDPDMEAAFEEIDYQIRALDAGFRIDVAVLPITHLNLHTRYDLPGYTERWSKTEKYFHAKHPARASRNVD